MEEKIELLKSDSKYIGTSCPHCEEVLVENDEMVKCPRCYQVQHAKCWMAKGGCTRRGCPQLAKAVFDDSPKGDGPLPPISRTKKVAGIAVAIIIVMLWAMWPKTPDPAAGKMKIEVLIEAALDENALLHEIANNFNEQNEDIYIEIQTTAASLIQEQILVRMGAGDAPDIFALSYPAYTNMLQQIGAMKQLGSEEDPVYGIYHPSQRRVLSLFIYTDYPEAAKLVLRYLLEEMPRNDLSGAVDNVSKPPYVLEIDEYLAR